MKFGDIKHILLLGGTSVLVELYDLFREAGFAVTVVTSPRHLQAQGSGSTGETLETILSARKVRYLVKTVIAVGDHDLAGLIGRETLAVSISAPWIFKQAVIEQFAGRFVNLHGAKLPQGRGGGNFSWKILQGERTGFAAIHKMEPGIDTGALLKHCEFMYPSSCRVPADFAAVSAREYIELFKEFIADLKDDKDFPELVQPEYLSSYWPRLSTDQHGYINWDWKLPHIERFICAFDEPYGGASTFLKGRKVRIKGCGVSGSDGVFHPFQNGLIYRKYNHRLFVATEQGALVVGRVLNDDQVNIFNEIGVGDRFYTPGKYLEAAKEYRAIFTAEGLKNDQ